MSDKLEKFILDNKSEFDNYEPSPELWQKVIKIDGKPNTVKSYAFYYVWRVAAILLIVFLSVFVYEQFIKKDNNLSYQNSESGELIEAENYYNHQIRQKLTELEKYYPEFSEVKYDVLNDLDELDKVAKELKTELGNNINNEEVVLNLIENYRLKLNLLEEVLNQLRQVKQENNEFEKTKNI